MKKVGTFLLIVLIGTLVGGRPVFASDYLIGSQDVLKITVYEHPDLTVEARVSEEGKISFPLIGEIEVKSLSTQQIEKRIAQALAGRGYLKDPQVTVFITQYRGQRILIHGEVAKPGSYEITGPTTILDAISMSMGLTPDAGYIITLIRKTNPEDPESKLERISVNVDQLLNEGDFNQNLQLRDKDILNIPRAFFYIYGAVNKPGAYRIEKNLTIRRAVSIAGGLTSKASQRRIEVTRREGDRDVAKKAAIDDAVQPDDVIRVKESIF